ncbi:SRPBCC family protein [Nocardia harenae]|uniref:SRPBCC family protein n=1 Tax=Nocardia harenae TaxID=358707 RepID=UPI0012EDC277|nr:SRPBCC family protein [Nocardia harenae]
MNFETTCEVGAAPATVFAALAAVERMPEWSGVHRSVRVESVDAQGRPEVVYAEAAVLGFTDRQRYRYVWTDTELDWNTEVTDHLRVHRGNYRVTASGTGSTVTIRYELVPALPVPGLLLRAGRTIAADSFRKKFVGYVESFTGEVAR